MMQQPDNSAVLDKVYEALNRHDPAGIAALATPDVTVEDVPFGHAISGRQAVETHYRGFFRAFPDASYASVHRLQQGDSVVDEWIIRGTNKGELQIGKLVVQPTNQSFEIRGATVFECSAGQVRSVRLYYDALSLASQLGLTKLLQARTVRE